MPGLGRISRPDPRDQNYPLRAAIRRTATLPRTKHWTLGQCLDQGETSQCVGHGWQGWRLASPIRDKANTPAVPDVTATTIYHAAQLLDGDRLPHDGTTVRAAAQVLADPNGPLSKSGKAPIAQYLWAQSMADVREYLLLHGPLVVGTNWYDGMFRPDAKGFLIPTGTVAGGHAWLLYGYSAISDVYTMRNSWGSSWGKGGRANIHGKDLEQLLFAEDGECCAAVEEAVI